MAVMEECRETERPRECFEENSEEVDACFEGCFKLSVQIMAMAGKTKITGDQVVVTTTGATKMIGVMRTSAMSPAWTWTSRCLLSRL